MKTGKITTILAAACMTITILSCKETKKDQSTTEEQLSEMGSEVPANNELSQEAKSKGVMASYLVLKDALVADSKEGAAKAGEALAKSLANFDVSRYTQEEQAVLSKIGEASISHAEHIVKSDMKHQREHFKSLSNDLIDMVAITGTEITLYQQFCPMYDNGGTWLSASKNVMNPYYGSKMLTCGKVEKTIK